MERSRVRFPNVLEWLGSVAVGECSKKTPEDELHQWWMDVKVIGVGEMMVRKSGRFSTTKGENQNN